MDEDIKKLVEGDEIDADKFVADMFNIQEDPDTKIDPESHKESLKAKKIKEAITRMSKRYSYIFHHIKKLFMPRKDMDAILETVESTLKVVVPEMVNETTDRNIRDSLLMVVKEAIKLEREKTNGDIDSMVADAVEKEQEHTMVELAVLVSNDVATYIPPQVDTFLKNYMKNHILHMHHIESASSLIHNLQQQLYLKIKDDEQVCNTDLPIWLALMYLRNLLFILVLTELILFAVVIMKTIMTTMLILRGRSVRKDKEHPSIVHIQELGLESYQVKVNLTSPNLIFPGIEEHKLYTITSLSFVGLIYENNKKKKRIMDIDEIPKFCHATLKRI
uniref:Uncharacterized protein n=1 Tax=Tanacetum cinerariifolium TaxID=118510 RepID=A0A6L2K0P1_TANCI|nr:hypothetical protein [Tanacetum cinerariifolium]